MLKCNFGPRLQQLYWKSIEPFLFTNGVSLVAKFLLLMDLCTVVHYKTIIFLRISKNIVKNKFKQKLFFIFDKREIRIT